MKLTISTATLLLLLTLPVNAENQLFFGVKGNHRDWTHIQGKAPRVFGSTPYLKEVYQIATEPAFLAYLQKEIQRTEGPVFITLVDDTLAGAHKVWPHARGREMQIAESYFQKYESARGVQAIRGLLAHEIAHTQDQAWLTRNAYGRDETHYRTEVITQRAAMIEGWADYQAIRFAPWQEFQYRSDDLCDITAKEKRRGRKGRYESHPLTTFTDWMRVEIAVARVLHELATGSPGGRQAVDEAFDATNGPKVRTLPMLLKEMVARNPERALKYATLVDGATEFTATDDELIEIFGEGGEVYVKQWRKLQQP